MKRPNGSGSISKLPSGMYRIRVTMADGSRVSRVFASFEEAERMRDACVAVLAEQHKAPVGAVTLRHFADRWFEQRERSGVRGVQTELSCWRTHVLCESWVDEPPSRITRKDIKDWIEKMRGKKARKRSAWRKSDTAEAQYEQRQLSVQTRKHALSLLRLCLAAAVEDNLLSENPAAGLTAATSREQGRSTDDFQILTADEIGILLESDQLTQDERDFLAFAIHTGLRPGEIFALRWEDVMLDGARPEITIRYSWESVTKTGQVRRVPLLRPAREALERWRSRCIPSELGLVWPRPDGMMFARKSDFGWGDRTRERGRVKPGMKTRAGITRHVTFYAATRHTCASHLLMGSWGPAWSIAEVGAFLGHSDQEVTQRYAKVLSTHLHTRALELHRIDGRVQRRAQAVGHELLSSNADLPGALVERVTGIEPATASLGSWHKFSRNKSLFDVRVQSVSNLARRVVEGVARGETPDAELTELAEAVLRSPLVRAAMAVAAGGAFRWARAMDLSELVLSGQDEWGMEGAG